MGTGDAIRKIARDPRDWFASGLVRSVDDHDDWGLVISVELTDGRTVEARPSHVGLGDGSGIYVPFEVDDEVLLVFDAGEVNNAVVLASKPVSRPQRPESEYDNDRIRITHPEAVEVRGVGDDEVHGVVVRTFLDDLSDHLQDLIDIGNEASGTASASGSGTITGSANLTSGAVTGSSALNAGTVSTINTLRSLLIDLGATAQALRTLVEQSRNAEGGTGGAPHCSPILRATDEG